ncbi:integrator complex subunit 9-like [Homalodisca vitripennis]|uniref:integrator complex subunit 9-like n=1 Tax=Homalodisca vitripennis TaxID=197043 RepID=UPI001EEB8945|nr:integrator complex subunit 9-like [Homalodisca vitripennis]
MLHVLTFKGIHPRCLVSAALSCPRRLAQTSCPLASPYYSAFLRLSNLPNPVNASGEILTLDLDRGEYFNFATSTATEPTLQIGRLYLEELVQFIEQSPKASLACHWKEFLHLMPQPLCEPNNRPRNWQQLYSLAQVQKSLARIQVLGYDQKMDVYGSLRVTPVSSGYCLGSSKLGHHLRP